MLILHTAVAVYSTTGTDLLVDDERQVTVNNLKVIFFWWVYNTVLYSSTGLVGPYKYKYVGPRFVRLIFEANRSASALKWTPISHLYFTNIKHQASSNLVSFSQSIPVKKKIVTNHHGTFTTINAWYAWR